MSKWLTDDEVIGLLKAFGHHRARQGFTTEEAQAVVNWGEEARINQGLLDGVLHGTVLVDVQDDGRLIFSAKRRPA